MHMHKPDRAEAVLQEQDVKIFIPHVSVPKRVGEIPERSVERLAIWMPRNPGA